MDGFISSELPVLFELRVRYLLFCERVSEAMALAKCCAWHPTAGQHLFFLQVYLSWLLKTSQNDILHNEVGVLLFLSKKHQLFLFSIWINGCVFRWLAWMVKMVFTSSVVWNMKNRMSCFWPSVESSSPSSFAGATCTVCGKQIYILMEGFHLHHVLGSNSDPQPCWRG